jgi:hypothetical protein
MRNHQFWAFNTELKSPRTILQLNHAFERAAQIGVYVTAFQDTSSMYSVLREHSFVVITHQSRPPSDPTCRISFGIAPATLHTLLLLRTHEAGEQDKTTLSIDQGMLADSRRRCG